MGEGEAGLGIKETAVKIYFTCTQENNVEDEKEGGGYGVWCGVRVYLRKGGGLKCK